MDLSTENGVPVIHYEDREKLKEEYYKNPTKDSFMLDYAHWMRFLDSLFNEDVPLEDRRYIKEKHPSFEVYRAWKKAFPGWSYDIMQPGHSARKKWYPMIERPMNRYYELNAC